MAWVSSSWSSCKSLGVLLLMLAGFSYRVRRKLNLRTADICNMGHGNWVSLKLYRWRSDCTFNSLFCIFRNFCVFSFLHGDFQAKMRFHTQTIRSSKRRRVTEGFQKKILWISLIMVMKLHFFSWLSFTWSVNIMKQINLFKISFSISNLM